MSKFDSVRDEILYGLSLTGLWGESDGDVESPTGWFWKVTISEGDLDEIRREFPGESADTYSALVGHFIMREDSSGFVYVTEYPHFGADSEGRDYLVLFASDWRNMREEFDRWNSQDDDF